MNKWISISVIVVLIAGFASSLFLYFQESSNLKVAQAEIVTLEGDVSTLGADLTAKEAEVSTLQSDLAAAEAKVSTLQTEVALLTQTLGEKTTLLIQAQEEMDTLQTEVTLLAQTLAQTKEEKDTLEVQILEWENAFLSIQSEISERLGDNEDAMKFVTPNDEMVTGLVNVITDGFSQDTLEMWNDITRLDITMLYYWVVINIDYSHDTPLPLLPSTPTGALFWVRDYWRMPEETIEDRTGDCEDMAVLLTSMIINYNEGRYDAWAIGIQSEYGGHMAVALPIEGGKLAILDPTGCFYTNSSGRLSAKPISQAINEWLQHWSKEMPNAYVDMVFNNEFYETFASTDEFIAWAE